MNTLVQPGSLERYMIVWGTFSPIRTDDLRPHWKAMIGRRSLWLVDAPVETGPYAGQWIFHPPEMGGWVPHCDLSDIVVPDQGKAHDMYYAEAEGASLPPQEVA